LNVLPIATPSLRQRGADIPLLVERFVDRYNSEKACQVAGFTQAALELLMRFDWPGNIRQLQNIVQRVVILKGDGIVGVDDLPETLRGGVGGGALSASNEPSVDIP